MKHELVRVAVIGTGGIAHSHVRKLREDPGAHVVACCDIVRKVARKFAATHAIPGCYDDAEAMLGREDLDAVVVSAADVAHAPMTLAALQRGLHVLCEKPMATTAAEARKMQRTAGKAGKIGMINFSYREMPGLDQARALIADGRLGRIMHVEASYLQSWLVSRDWRNRISLLWRMSRRHRGGTLNDIGCHIIDLVTCLVGDCRSVSCATKCFDKGVPGNRCRGYKLDADDSFVATVRFANGAFGTIHSTRWATGHSNDLRVRIFGDRGSLCFHTNGHTEELRVCLGDFHTGNALWTTVPIRTPKVAIQQRFLNSIRTGRPEAPTFEDGLRNQAILDACHRSALENKTVTLRTPSKTTHA